MAHMRIGQLRHRVYVQTATLAQNSRGAETVSWVDSVALSALVNSVSGTERQTHEQVIATATHTVTLRLPMPSGLSLTTKSRIKWGSRLFGVAALAETDNAGRWIVASCMELVGKDAVL